MRVVLDTNVLVSGIFFGGIPGQVLDLWIKRSFSVYTTPRILKEYLETLARLGSKIDPALIHLWSEILPNLCHIIPDLETYPPVSRDSSDDKFIYCAAHSRSHFLITGDLDLKILAQRFIFKIVSPREFLKLV